VRGQETSDGAGVKLRRSLGSPQLSTHDPFLLLDEFKSEEGADYIGGFPDHPHRGFETVTYMLAGSMEHKDHVGNSGNLVAGSVQWMTAGRGIIHSEMPKQEEGLLWGFQLWVNLPATRKMDPPRYQDIPPGEVVERRESNGTLVRVLAGSSRGVEGPVRGIATDPVYLDVTLPAGERFSEPMASELNGMIYLFEGEAMIGESEKGKSGSTEGSKLQPGELAVLGAGDRCLVQALEAPARFLVLAARPIGEPIARYGPFVMNTRQEISRAVQELNDGTFLKE
jgi:redox-sensitive bicupin YhaK (pirin superfamily)